MAYPGAIFACHQNHSTDAVNQLDTIHPHRKQTAIFKSLPELRIDCCIYVCLERIDVRMGSWLKYLVKLSVMVVMDIFFTYTLMMSLF